MPWLIQAAEAGESHSGVLRHLCSQSSSVLSWMQLFCPGTPAAVSMEGGKVYPTHLIHNKSLLATDQLRLMFLYYDGLFLC